MTTPDPNPDPISSPNRRRRWPWVIPLALVLAVVLVLGASYRVYGEWPWSKYPTRLHACGRDFVRQGSQTRAQIEAQGNTLAPLGTVPGWLNSGKLWTTSLGDPLPGQKCHVAMWVQTSSNSFESYNLSGGP